ncbi:MAG TPA: hypothetical protein VFE23_21200 [Usitatibacter sp.]|jgi:hypothetical protein|nr:hypothetical protein [Usitatibacter sp.]
MQRACAAIAFLLASTGAVGEFSGAFSAGVLELTGETHRADGTRIQRRMTLAPEAGGGVVQTSLAGREGAALKPHYELHYSRVATP